MKIFCNHLKTCCYYFIANQKNYNYDYSHVDIMLEPLSNNLLKKLTAKDTSVLKLTDS